jgi:DNA-directed RNA polymerase specialized sigma24 family protein
MPTAEEFDEFYVTTRRRLVLQTFLVTGDLGASRSAVRDAYVAARHHWGKVGRIDLPEQWVRPRAWTMAQRRHTARPWRREKSLTPEQARLFEALQRLTDVQRKTLVLTHLAAMPMGEIAREVGVTQQLAEQHLQTATAAVALALDTDATSIRARLESLGPIADSVKLPRPSIIRRSGVRRRRTHALAGSALAVLVTIGVGALVAPDAAAPPPPRPASLVSKQMLLTSEQAAPLAAGQAWTVAGTSDNTRGTGINTMCQAAQFADTKGLGTWVRTFQAPAAGRGLVQTVEISGSRGAAERAYGTTLGWYAGCTVPRIQLVDASTVSGLGDEAVVLRMRIPGAQPRSFVVGIARTGSLTTSAVLETRSSTPAPTGPLVSTLATSVQNLCRSRVSGGCLGAVATQPTLPPATGETPGMLAIADLPVISNVMAAWAGTDPVPATVNLAATTCDQADFAGSGADHPVTRTYLIPEADLPKRFGLSETLGRFASPRAAGRFVERIVARMKACPDKDLGSTISHASVHVDRPAGSSYALWRLENQVNKEEKVVPFWMGVAQSGRYVAQVNLTPVGRYDVSPATFESLVVRARDRLAEVSR